jgi:Histidine kinase-, DNA gyrase B-, and HSP90-like ATPase
MRVVLRRQGSGASPVLTNGVVSLDVLLTGLAAGGVAFRWAFDKAIELQDALLLQIGSLAISGRLPPPGTSERGVDDVDRMFEPFVRGEQREGEGSGLGLSIVRRIVDRLGGTIALQNVRAVDRSGLRVTVSLRPNEPA